MGDQRSPKPPAPCPCVVGILSTASEAQVVDQIERIEESPVSPILGIDLDLLSVLSGVYLRGPKNAPQGPQKNSRQAAFFVAEGFFLVKVQRPRQYREGRSVALASPTI